MEPEVRGDEPGPVVVSDRNGLQETGVCGDRILAEPADALTRAGVEALIVRDGPVPAARLLGEGNLHDARGAAVRDRPGRQDDDTEEAEAERSDVGHVSRLS
jgi:hypothetical protein